MLINRMLMEDAQMRREQEIAERLSAKRYELEPRSNPIRRAIGRSMISIGHRLAAEPQPRLARSQ